ncbi:hypothetical protein BZA77DRAFT_355663 [Pyronema omphalodes]|nr:hypothetical protein BZA77DRAFT_355663 [Pyronema omphalodes]
MVSSTPPKDSTAEVQETNFATSELIEKYKEENSRLRKDIQKLENTVNEAMGDFSSYIENSLDDHDQCEQRINALEKELKIVRESKRELLKQLTTIIDAHTDK